MSEAPDGGAPPRTAIPTEEFRPRVLLPVLQEVLAQQGRFIFSLHGNSMRPTLPEECEIEVVPLVGAPQPGQLMVFAVADSLVVHRCVATRDGLWIAQGDNRRGPDGPVQPKHVLGMVAAANVRGRQVWPRRGERIWARLWVARYHVLQAARRALRKAGR